jgi:hypothetical protein
MRSERWEFINRLIFLSHLYYTSPTLRRGIRFAFNRCSSEETTPVFFHVFYSIKRANIGT